MQDKCDAQYVRTAFSNFFVLLHFSREFSAVAIASSYSYSSRFSGARCDLSGDWECEQAFMTSKLGDCGMRLSHLARSQSMFERVLSMLAASDRKPVELDYYEPSRTDFGYDDP